VQARAGRDVHALCGLLEDQRPRARGQAPRHRDLLLVAAGEGGQGLLNGGRAHIEIGHHALRQRFLVPMPGEAEGRKVAQHGERGVLAHVHPGDDGLPVAVAGDVRNAQSARGRGAGRLGTCVRRADPSGAGADHAGQAPGQLLPAAAREARDPQNLARVQVQGDALHRTVGAKVAHLEERRGVCTRGAARATVGNLPPDHHRHDPRAIGFRGL